MDFVQIVQHLKIRLQEPLPGDEVRHIMSPSLRFSGNWKLPDPEKANYAGVLLMLYPHQGTVYTSLMQRNTDGHAHSGQISLPGGKQEPDDNHLIATALRETREEFGINDSEIQILGSLSRLYIPASNFWVLPSVGYLNSRPQFNPDRREVAAVIEVPLQLLQDERIIKTTTIKNSRGVVIEAPYYDIEGHIVWGATAMIISEFLYLLKG